MTQRKALAQDQQGKKGKKPETHPETLAKFSTILVHWSSLGRREIKPTYKPTSGISSETWFSKESFEQLVKPVTVWELGRP